MAEVVHEHVDSGSNSSGMGFLLGTVLLIVLAVALLYWGIPALQRSSGTNVNIPDRMDINVNQGGATASTSTTWTIIRK